MGGRYCFSHQEDSCHLLPSASRKVQQTIMKDDLTSTNERSFIVQVIMDVFVLCYQRQSCLLC